MMYVAKFDIGGFKKGEEVPKDLAEVWNAMYAEPPCELIETKKSESVPESEKKAKKIKPKKK